jgi:predicted membrane protein
MENILTYLLFLVWLISSIFLVYDVKRVSNKISTTMIYILGCFLVWGIIIPV